MGIPPHARELNDRFSNLELCAERAPEGMYLRAREAAEAVGEASNAMRQALIDRGFVALNDDRLRAVEAMMYGYLLQGNDNETELAVAEGFGDAMNGPAAERVLEQAERDRDAVVSLNQLSR